MKNIKNAIILFLIAALIVTSYMWYRGHTGPIELKIRVEHSEYIEEK